MKIENPAKLRLKGELKGYRSMYEFFHINEQNEDIMILIIDDNIITLPTPTNSKSMSILKDLFNRRRIPLVQRSYNSFEIKDYKKYIILIDENSKPKQNSSKSTKR